MTIVREDMHLSDPSFPHLYPWRAVPQIQGILKDCFHDNYSCFCVAMVSLEGREKKGGNREGKDQGVWEGSLTRTQWTSLSLTVVKQSSRLAKANPGQLLLGLPNLIHPHR